MNEPPNRYDVSVTVARDGGYLPDPAEFAVAAGQAASSWAAGVMSAHMAEQFISVVTVEAADKFSAVAVAWPWFRSAKASGRVTQPLSGRSWPSWCGGPTVITLMVLAGSW